MFSLLALSFPNVLRPERPSHIFLVLFKALKSHREVAGKPLDSRLPKRRELAQMENRITDMTENRITDMMENILRT
jgi:hypothetical protein